jgi:hypothetical protein
MAELILTQQEKDAALWSDLDDASLGKLVKKTMAIFDSLPRQEHEIVMQSAAIMLCCLVRDNQSTKATITLEGVTEKGVGIGDWRLLIEQVKAPEVE